jgi:hypothetical protein
MKRMLKMKRMLVYGLGVAAPIALILAVMNVISAQQPSPKKTAETPRLPNGHPDLNGVWSNAYPLDMYHLPVEGSAYVTPTIIPLDKKLVAAGTFAGVDERTTGTIINSRRCAPSQHEVRKAQGRDQCDEATNETVDSELTTALDPNRPLYKPEYWTKVQDLDYDTNNQDPQMVCQSLGVPRMGPPRKIVQTAKEAIFLYGDETRIIPTDGRGHDPKAEPSFRGDSVGRWEGDTFVVDVTSFNDRTWLAGGLAGDGARGYFHGYEMHVIERFTRHGANITYDVTVEDPEMLLEPWHKNPMELKLNPNPNARLTETPPCNMEYDKSTMVGRTRH